MKTNRLFTGIEASLTGFFLGFSALACLVTAFAMPGVNLWLLALYCMLGACVCAVLTTRRMGWLLLLLLVLGGAYLLQKGVLEDSAESLLYKISRVYYDAYKWPIIRWSWRTADDMLPTLPPAIYILGTLLSILTAWTVCKGQSSIVACLPAAFPVAACFVVTDSLPDTIYLVLFLTAVVLMMLCSATRQKDRVQGRRLAAMAAIPVFIAVGVLFLAVPEQTYYHKEKAQAISDFLVGKYTLEQMMDRLAGNPIQLEQKKVDLSAVGARIENNAKILEVTPRQNGGTLYLRTTSLDRYTGKQWVDSETPLSTLYWPEYAEGVVYRYDEVVIKTQYAHEMLYLPYYAAGLDLNTITRGYRNTKKLNEYSIAQVFMSHWDVQFEADRTTTSAQQVDIAAATRLPDETKKWAIPLAKEIVGNQQDPYYQALYIGEYVKNSARYDTKTSRMSKEYTDFAQWFLEESETGYCIHFATAGAVLLKALDIPARYVTGYMVNTRAGTTTEVLGTHAHAWVEYWLPGFGWTVLECTPPAEETPDTPEATHSATTPQQPDTTVPVLTPDLAPQTPGTQESKDTQWLWWLLMPVIPFGLWLQGALRRNRRRQKCTAGTPNQNALACWQEAEKLSRYLGETPPEQLRSLAEKAKFSPYTLTGEELNQFHLYLRRCQHRLEKKNFLLRLWHKWMIVLY